MDTLQQMWTALLQKSIAKGVKGISKQVENSVLTHWKHFEYNVNDITATDEHFLPYDFINVMSLYQRKFVNTAESCNGILKFGS